jgi:hypothetical protein
VDPVLLTHRKTGREVVLPAGGCRVGRGRGNRIRLSSASTSRQHALLERDGDQVWVTDLGSRNGTYVNGLAVPRGTRVPVAPGDEVRFGPSTAFTVTGCRTPPPPDPPSPAPPAPPAGEGTVVHAAPDTTGYGSDRNFGFEANRVDFAAEGVAAEAAAKLRDRFHPIQVLSSGGMGKIILVQEVLSGRFVAMKVMLERAAADPSLVQQFVREAVITARLQHPHVIPVHDLGFLDGNQLYYTMSYVEGVPFRKLISTADLPERVRILRCAALAVAHAHAKGLWHRDLKPENILVGPLGDTYVIDWGLVSVQPGREFTLNIPKVVVGNLDLVIPDDLLRKTSDALTAAGTGQGAIGTPLYMSPEQVYNTAADLGPASDVWAVGMMLYEALAGVHPLRAACRSQSVMELFLHIAETDIPPPSAVAPGVPAELDVLCVRMLDKDRARRPDLAEFVRASGRFLRQHGVAVAADAAAAPVRDDELAALRAENERLRAEVERLRRRRKRV